MENLISMTDYVLEQDKTSLPLLTTNWHKEFETRFKNIVNYAKFLSMPLELKMFVPVDYEGNVLVEPKNYKQWLKKALNTPYDLDLSKYEKYQKAESEVIFEGFKMSVGEEAVSNNENCIILIHNNGKYSVSGRQVIKIEDLVKYNLKLTPNAKLKYKL